MVARQSLSRRVFFTVFFVAMAVVAVFSLLGAFYLRSRITDSTRRELEEETRLISVMLDESPDDVGVLKKLQLDGARLTLIDRNGQPIYDSKSDAASLPNHGSRPEVKDAFEKGHGTSERSSTTLGETMIYEARLLSDGDVLRLSRSQAGLMSIFSSLVMPIAALALIGLVVSYFTARREANAIIAPLTLVDLDHPKRNAEHAYIEMLPMLERIESQRKELKRQMRVLANNDRMRREFTANITHELKTPLTAISGYAELIANGMVSKEEDKRDFARRIFKEAGRLTALVNDILTLSNLDEAEHSDETSNADVLGTRDVVNLPRLMESVSQRLEPVAAKNNVELRLDCEPAQVIGVPRLLDEMVYNLASNAIRYNRPGGTVTLSCGTLDAKSADANAKDAVPVAAGEKPSASAGSSAAGSASGPVPYLRVSDTGLGIAKDEQQKIFERFYRVDKSRSKARGGTGLGLAIVKHAALFHQAKIQLESELGKGSVFTVTFPVKLSKTQNTAATASEGPARTS